MPGGASLTVTTKEKLTVLPNSSVATTSTVVSPVWLPDTDNVFASADTSTASFSAVAEKVRASFSGSESIP